MVVQAVRKDKTRISRTFLNVFQVVLMMELLKTFGMCGVYQRAGGLESCGVCYGLSGNCLPASSFAASVGVR